MAPFTHHQQPCLLGSPTRVMIQHHLQLSLLQTQNGWLWCQSQLAPLLSSFFRGVSQQVMADPSQYELFSNLLRLPERTELFELFESIFLTVCMCRSMKPLEWGYPGDEVVCLMPKPERNLANSLLWNGGPLSDTISSGYPSIEKRSIRRSLNDQNDVLAL